MTAGTTWPTLRAFYAEEPARGTSPEHDFGSHWIEDAGSGQLLIGNPKWRVVLIVDTGEVIAHCVASSDWCDYGGQVWRLAKIYSPSRHLAEKAVHETLRGWSAHCGQPYGLTWVRRQLRRLSHPAHGAT